MYKIGKVGQFLVSISLVLVVSAICFGLSGFIGYRTVALILMVTVSLIAMFFDVLPILLAALLSALIWNFFFIPPRFTLVIGSAEDIMMFCMYFVIAILNVVLTYKIREKEKFRNQVNERARMQKIYSNLLDSLSHELRTPLSVITKDTDNLASDKISSENKTELIHEISVMALRLNQQLENILNVTRLESGAVTPKKGWVNAGDLIHHLVRNIEEKNGRQIHISVPPGIPLFKLDHEMTEQAIFHLLDNAVRYTPAKTRIDIALACHINVLEITIEDDGPGFPKNGIGKVFDKLYRAEHEKKGGIGLGLFIARGFIEAQNGSIIVQNRQEGGVRFKITIPTEVK